MIKTAKNYVHTHIHTYGKKRTYWYLKRIYIYIYISDELYGACSVLLRSQCSYGAYQKKQEKNDVSLTQYFVWIAQGLLD